MSGIQREVLLYTPSDVGLRDVRADASLTADYRHGQLTVDVDVLNHPAARSSGDGVRVSVEVFEEPATPGAIPAPLIAFDSDVPSLTPGQQTTVRAVSAASTCTACS